jgi:hypothetical protein
MYLNFVSIWKGPVYGPVLITSEVDVVSLEYLHCSLRMKSKVEACKLKCCTVVYTRLCKRRTRMKLNLPNINRISYINL